MQRHILTSFFVLGLTVGATAGWADCAEELQRLTEGISKDGSIAPLQEPAAATPQTGDATAGDATGGQSDSAEDEVGKTGETAPLESDPAQAMSGEDAQAQSAGGATAAEQAEGAAPGAANTDAIARARAALDAGDEAACLEALESAKG